MKSDRFCLFVSVWLVGNELFHQFGLSSEWITDWDCYQMVWQRRIKPTTENKSNKSNNELFWIHRLFEEDQLLCPPVLLSFKFKLTTWCDNTVLIYSNKVTSVTAIAKITSLDNKSIFLYSLCSLAEYVNPQLLCIGWSKVQRVSSIVQRCARRRELMLCNHFLHYRCGNSEPLHNMWGGHF